MIQNFQVTQDKVVDLQSQITNEINEIIQKLNVSIVTNEEQLTVYLSQNNQILYERVKHLKMLRTQLTGLLKYRTILVRYLITG